MKSSSIFVGIVLCVFTATSFALPVKTTWSGTVTNILGPEADEIWDIGDTVTWATIYDSESQISHLYNDGVNGIGEFGKGDDSLLDTYTNPYGPGTTIADAQYVFDANILELQSRAVDTMANNRSAVDIAGFLTLSEYFKDGFLLYAYEWLEYARDLKNNPLINNLIGIDFDPRTGTFGDGVMVNLSRLTLNTEPFTAVPEPKSILLLVLGFLMLHATMRYRSKQRI